jgi:hypothetical protein
MNTRKLRWLNRGGCVINLDNVDVFLQEETSVLVRFNNDNNSIRLKDTTLDEIRHYLKYGKPKRR